MRVILYIRHWHRFNLQLKSSQQLVTFSCETLLRLTGNPLVRLTLAKLCLDPFAILNFVAQSFVKLHQAGKVKDLGNDPHKRNDGAPRCQRRDEFHDARETVDGIPEDDRINQVGRTAGKNESYKEPKYSGKWNILAAQRKVGEDAWNRHVRSKNGQVRANVQPSERVTPHAAPPSRRETVRIKKAY